MPKQSSLNQLYTVCVVHCSLSECQRRLLFKTLLKSFLFKSEIVDTFPIYRRYVLKSSILHFDDKMGEAVIQLY